MMCRIKVLGDLKTKTFTKSFMMDKELLFDQESDCEEVVRITLVQQKAMFWNGSAFKYLLFITKRDLSEVGIEDIFQPYYVITELDIKTTESTIVNLKLKNGYKNKYIVKIQNGSILKQQEKEEISSAVYTVYRKVFKLCFCLYNTPFFLFFLFNLAVNWFFALFLTLPLFLLFLIPVNFYLWRGYRKARKMMENTSKAGDGSLIDKLN